MASRWMHAPMAWIGRRWNGCSWIESKLDLAECLSNGWIKILIESCFLQIALHLYALLYCDIAEPFTKTFGEPYGSEP